MVPLALLIWLLAELAVCATLARHFLDTSWGISAIVAAGTVLGLRAAIVAVTWGFARAYPSPARRLSAAESLRMIAGEYAAFLLIFVFILPFERLWMGRDRLRPCSRPLLLVHGYSCSRGVWWLLRRQLEAAGHTVATVSLAPPYTNIGKLVPRLAQRIENVCRATGADRVVLVAHSMGGLAVRAFLAQHGTAAIGAVVTLGTPHRGTWLARFGYGRNVAQMRLDSGWLRDLAAREAGQTRAPFTVVLSYHDNIVVPQSIQTLEGARTIELIARGHVELAYDRGVWARALEAIETPGRG